jgi:hypothetical protein
MQFALVLVMLLVVVAGVLAQEFSTGDYTPTEPGEVHQTLPHTRSTDSIYSVGAYPLSPLTLAQGDGRQEVQDYCKTCHSPIYITMQPALPAGTWSDEVNKMIKTFGAEIPDDATQKIIHYLQSNYSVENRKS